ncbi:sigma factor-like helix-turn-helix DNA-binding protein [Gordonia sp. 'Campus']|uniref:sigma factor-like helix-turn-helix DNA-binding protein n=1 Tax=Gordonia sp. 'Campus' TaxID=2915824 RepID=UPI001EE4598C|nr:sigma factor-like helix-turn-helix DNA-binding protein [Gordonia sp. 'Campus']
MTAHANGPVSTRRSPDDRRALDAIAAFDAGLSDQERLVLTERIYAANPRTQSEVADLLGLSRERVTQIDRSTRHRLAALIDADPALSELWAMINRRAAPVADAAALMADSTLAGIPVGDVEAPCWRVVAAASGLRTSENWIIRGSLRSVAEFTKSAVSAAARPGEVAPVVTIADHLGLSPDSTARWLRRVGYELLDDHAVAIRSTTGEIIVAALSIRGTPLTFDEIVDATSAIPRAHNSIRNAFTSDARIVKTDRTRYGLAEWGLPRYESVHLQIDAILSDRDGAVPLDDIIATIRGRHDVSEATIRAYAGAGEFQIRGGVVTRRERPHRPRRTPGRTRGLYREDDAVHWATTITPAQCRGTGFNIPSALAGVLGIGPGTPISLETPLGPQTFTWASVQARSGSIKRFIDALELTAGAAVFLDFGPDTFAVRRAEHSGASPTSAILTRLGRRPERVARPRLTRILAESLWLPTDSTTDRIIDLLVSRRETDLADRVVSALH